MTDSIHTKEMQALKTWLLKCREEKGLSMRELADLLQKPHSFVQKVESGDRRLDVVEYFWYCQALQVDPKVGIDVLAKSK